MLLEDIYLKNSAPQSIPGPSAPPPPFLSYSFIRALFSNFNNLLVESDVGFPFELLQLQRKDAPWKVRGFQAKSSGHLHTSVSRHRLGFSPLTNSPNLGASTPHSASQPPCMP